MERGSFFPLKSECLFAEGPAALLPLLVPQCEGLQGTGQHWPPVVPRCLRCRGVQRGHLLTA